MMMVVHINLCLHSDTVHIVNSIAALIHRKMKKQTLSMSSNKLILLVQFLQLRDGFLEAIQMLRQFLVNGSDEEVALLKFLGA